MENITWFILRATINAGRMILLLSTKLLLMSLAACSCECRLNLASHSEYFRARTSKQWAETELLKNKGRQVLVERVEPDLVS